MTVIFCLLARCLGFIFCNLRLGTGVTWSGELALKVRPNILSQLIPTTSPVILIAGTNGKTTTAKMVKTILESKYQVICNETGANLVNGLVGTILTQQPLFSKKQAAYVFEIDESSLPLALKAFKPTTLVLLNLFRDQLDRYGEVDTIVAKWEQAFSSSDLSKTNLIVNGDDPQLAYLGQKYSSKVFGLKTFGLNNSDYYLSASDHATDSIFCPACGHRLVFTGVYFSHLGTWHCSSCNFKQPSFTLSSLDVHSPLEGLYNRYNVMAALLVAEATGVKKVVAAERLVGFKPAFGRLEELKYQNKNVKVLLSKNPAGFTVSLRALLESSQRGPIVLLLNDHVADGRDVSWIWDVDFELLKGCKFPIYVSGTRAYDLGLRLKYALGATGDFMIDLDLKSTINRAVVKAKTEETIWVLGTYTAMLEARKILTGRKIL